MNVSTTIEELLTQMAGVVTIDDQALTLVNEDALHDKVDGLVQTAVSISIRWLRENTTWILVQSYMNEQYFVV